MPAGFRSSVLHNDKPASVVFQFADAVKRNIQNRVWQVLPHKVAGETYLESLNRSRFETDHGDCFQLHGFSFTK
jgi:hypothetical protein